MAHQYSIDRSTTLWPNICRQKKQNMLKIFTNEMSLRRHIVQFQYIRNMMNTYFTLNSKHLRLLRFKNVCVYALSGGYNYHRYLTHRQSTFICCLTEAAFRCACTDAYTHTHPRIMHHTNANADWMHFWKIRNCF